MSGQPPVATTIIATGLAERDAGGHLVLTRTGQASIENRACPDHNFMSRNGVRGAVAAGDPVQVQRLNITQAVGGGVQVLFTGTIGRAVLEIAATRTPGGQLSGRAQLQHPDANVTLSNLGTAPNGVHERVAHCAIAGTMASLATPLHLASAPIPR